MHAEELQRFESLMVRGPGRDDCAIWVSVIGGDGYGPNRTPRTGGADHGADSRYALALARRGTGEARGITARPTWMGDRDPRAGAWRC